MYFKTHSLQNKVNELSYVNDSLKSSAIYINMLQKEFDNKKDVLKKLKSVLSATNIKEELYILNVSKDNINLEIEKISNDKASKFINKLINTSFKIIYFEVMDTNLSQSIKVKISL
jgi:hypothetical protein